MKAIQTRYLGPTETKGERIKAWADGWGSVTVSHDYGLRPEEEHERAARKLLERAEYVDNDPELVWGGLPNGDYVFCFADSKIQRESN